MATESLLSKVNVFPSLTSFNDNASAVDSNSLNLIKTSAVIIETWHSGDNWYRKWSDGYVEQGGEFTVTSTYKTLTLNVEFPMVDYSFIFIPNDTDNAHSIAVRNRTTNTIELKSGASNHSALWYACGY